MIQKNALYSDATVMQYDPNLCDPKIKNKTEHNDLKTEQIIKKWNWSKSEMRWNKSTPEFFVIKIIKINL